MILKKWTARKRLSRDTSQSTECFTSENTIRNNALASFASSLSQDRLFGGRRERGAHPAHFLDNELHDHARARRQVSS